MISVPVPESLMSKSPVNRKRRKKWSMSSRTMPISNSMNDLGGGHNQSIMTQRQTARPPVYSMFNQPSVGGSISKLPCDRFTLQDSMDPGPADYISERSKDFLAKKGESHKFPKTKKEFWMDKEIKHDSPGFIYQPQYYFLSKKLTKR